MIGPNFRLKECLRKFQCGFMTNGVLKRIFHANEKVLKPIILLSGYLTCLYLFISLYTYSITLLLT